MKYQLRPRPSWCECGHHQIQHETYNLVLFYLCKKNPKCEKCFCACFKPETFHPDDTSQKPSTEKSE